MPGLVTQTTAGHKRTRENGETARSLQPRKAAKRRDDADDSCTRISTLEEQLNDGLQHLNNIVALQAFINNGSDDPKAALLAAVALCRVFCRLIATEKLSHKGQATEQDIQIVRWLKERLKEYVQSVTGWIGSPSARKENAAVALLMRIVKQEARQETNRADQAMSPGKAAFGTLINRLLSVKEAESARQEFVQRYIQEFDDVRYFTLLTITNILTTDSARDTYRAQALEILTNIEDVPESSDQLRNWVGRDPSNDHRLRSIAAHRKAAQECWLSIFRTTLTPAERKKILNIMTVQILPWFHTRMEILTDFLTDSFNGGGALALLALSGLFELITRRNLDYPDFYTKLYSLLDEDLLHSTYRNRFLGLLEKFMSSSHLPAAMVASFIKRLARLSLEAPPGAIVWIVPWVYNMMRAHPSCTFTLHRPYHPEHVVYSKYPKYEVEGMDDPFSMAEMDPMLTGAIDSSMWELYSLQSHWHANVATLARILGEQFTKREYNLQDFLDHSYAGLLDAELGKDIKSKPELEWEIPKRILTADDSDGNGSGLNDLGTALQAAICV